jgi:predicted O-methyltransferase YrrM
MYDLNITGYMEENDLKQIELWASEVPSNGTIVEVGSFRGRSAICWAASCDPSVTVYCIDPFEVTEERGDDYEAFKENTGHLKNVISIRGISPYDIVYPGAPIDIFFLDAAHTNPSDLDNIEYFLPFIKKGGLLCGHDYNTSPGCMPPDVEANIKMLEERFNQPVTLYPGTLLWSFRM